MFHGVIKILIKRFSIKRTRNLICFAFFFMEFSPNYANAQIKKGIEKKIQRDRKSISRNSMGKINVVIPMYANIIKVDCQTTNGTFYLMLDFFKQLEAQHLSKENDVKLFLYIFNQHKEKHN